LPPAWLAALRNGARNTPPPGIGIPEGQRNDAVFREACRLRAQKRALDDALGALRDFNQSRCTPPLDDHDLQSCIKSAWRYEREYELNDLGNAQRFVAHVDGNVRYVIELRSFYYWDQQRWREDPDDLVCHSLMKESNALIWDEARNCNDEK